VDFDILAIGHANGNRDQIHFSAKGSFGTRNLRLLTGQARKGHDHDKGENANTPGHAAVDQIDLLQGALYVPNDNQDSRPDSKLGLPESDQ
jgi:hypothetical protein